MANPPRSTRGKQAGSIPAIDGKPRKQIISKRARKTKIKAETPPAERWYPNSGSLQKGTELWRLRDPNHDWTASRAYNAPDLFAKVQEYFDYMAGRPLQEARLSAGGHLVEVPKMRSPTFASLFVFLDITQKTWWRWRTDRPDLADVIAWTYDVMYAIKFEAAAAGLLNPLMISRDLGLAEKTENTGSVTVTFGKEDQEL